MKNEVVLYDFCGTLVDFQTANAYVEYVVRRSGVGLSFPEIIRRGLHRLHILRVVNRFCNRISLNKYLLLQRIKGMTYEVLNDIAKEYYEHRIKSHLIETTLNRLKNDIAIGKTVVLISGGYDIYIKYFAEDYKIPHVICSELCFKNGLFTGDIVGNDCMGQEKVTRLLNYFPKIKSDSDSSMTLYSDSDSDKPLFMICDKRFAVINRYPAPEWTQAIQAEVIKI